MYTYQDLQVGYVCGYVYIPGPQSQVWSRYGVGMYMYQDL